MPLSGEISAECAQFTIIETMNNTIFPQTQVHYAFYIACTINAYLQTIIQDYALKQSTSCMLMISGRIGNVL